MAITDIKGNWIDGAGNKVPKKYISKIDKLRDAFVMRLIKLVLREHDHLSKLKQFVKAEIEKHLSFIGNEYNIKSNPGGNYTFTNFSGDMQIEVQIASFISFDERLQFAKSKIDECIEKWSEGANEKLKIIIYDAFKVDKKGNVDTKRILGLRNLSIKDNDWEEAIKLINDAIKVTSKKEYIRFKTRNPKGDFETIKLDFANV